MKKNLIRETLSNMTIDSLIEAMENACFALCNNQRKSDYDYLELVEDELRKRLTAH